MSYELVEGIIEHARSIWLGLDPIDEIVSGNARGVDQYGEMWAEKNEVPVKHFPANWERHGRKAGFLRNQEMAEYADFLIAVWDGRSRGTRHMINIMEKMGKPHHVEVVVCE